ncbi:3217_t:CDS:2 [Acaulospora morrowiae]|uniref:3217_t:CDS:1 n=1 Tax=Acaulospora morrowiae TaxID=94023 RepID=A0A9N9ARA4_9GLOM|nr:3217_t:CDS:2 [Acaulospora morrowiae]
MEMNIRRSNVSKNQPRQVMQKAHIMLAIATEFALNANLRILPKSAEMEESNDAQSEMNDSNGTKELAIQMKHLMLVIVASLKLGYNEGVEISSGIVVLIDHKLLYIGGAKILTELKYLQI